MPKETFDTTEPPSLAKIIAEAIDEAMKDRDIETEELKDYINSLYNITDAMNESMKYFTNRIETLIRRLDT